MLHAAVLLAAAVQGAHAQNGPWLPRLQLDNDAYNFWIHPAHRTDEEYSNGVVASLDALYAPWWGRFVDGGRAQGCGLQADADGKCLKTSISIAQRIYTPNLFRPPFSYPEWENERPYAGILYVGASAYVISNRRQRQVDLALGVTGEPALGQTAQRIAHWINKRYTTRATGWETQVGFQPVVQAGWRESLLALRVATAGRGWLDLVPFAGVTLGTAHTSADAGARIRVGYNVSHPWDPRLWKGREPLEFFVTAGARGEYVAREFSLDGSFMESDGRHVERIPSVREFEVGAGLRMHRLRLEWSATTRSREYSTGPTRHVYSTMAAAWEFVP